MLVNELRLRKKFCDPVIEIVVQNTNSYEEQE